MGLFSKRKKDELGFTINTEEDSLKITGDKNLAPHAITAQEVSELWALGNTQENYSNNSALDSLKKRMNASIEQNETKPESNAKVSLPNQPKETMAKDAPKVNNEPNNITKSISINPNKSVVKEKPIPTTENKSLVEKVKRYTVDEQGHDMSQNQAPIYELQSVADILKTSGEDAIKSLSKKYGLDFSFDDLGKNKAKEIVDTPVVTEETSEKPKEEKIYKPIDKTSPTPTFEKMVTEAEVREKDTLYKNLFKENQKSEMPDISVPDISDIDTHEVGTTNDTPISNTATIRFTPIKNSSGNTDRITITNLTRQIDLGDTVIEDISSNSVTNFEESEFEEFSPTKEYTDTASGKKILHQFAVQKRFYFLSSVASALVVAALLLFLIPPINDSLIAHPKNTMFICTGMLLIAVLANVNMFFDFKNLMKNKTQFDIMSSLCAVFTLSFGMTAAFTNSNAYYTILLCAIILFTRALYKFKNISAQHKGLKLIINDREKNAVTLINDPATTFAMVKNAIEGDVLIAAHKKSKFIKDFVKHLEYHKTLNGKVSIIFFATLALSVLCGTTAYFYYDSIFYAFFTITSISCFAAIPTAFFIDALPYSSATKKLRTSGTMIAGMYGAEKIENANATVVNVNDIFPAGSITLHNMQVLSNNNIDEILLRAASLTAAVNSPLKPIFEQIAGTNTSYTIPDSDTVKYEKNLGISGWVDNEPLFIGNRSLMNAHGIEIPSLEVDKKILRKGFFPVYVATANTACALIVVQYNVNPVVAKQLHKITNLGILLLVENCDPNVTDQMICDYFGLYEDSVKIMTNAGLHMYKNLVPDVDSTSSPAIFRGSGLNFIKLINCASGIKKCNRLLTVFYVIFAVIGMLYFVYAAFSGIVSMPQQTTVFLYCLATTLLSIIGFLIRKP